MRPASESSFLHGLRQIDDTAAEWDELADRVDAEPWHRPGWYRRWWLAFGDGPLAVYTLRRDGRLTALAPIVRGPLGWRPPTNWHSPSFSLLAEDDDARAELLRRILADRPSWLTLPFLAPDEAVTAARVAAELGHLTLARTHVRSPYVPTAGGLDDLWTSDIDTRKSLRELERRRKRLAKEGGAFAVDDGTHDIDALLAEALPVEASGWKAELGTAIVSSPDTLQFYEAIMRWAAERGYLRVMSHRVDGRMVACEMCFEYGDRVAIIKGGIDPEWKKFAVGVLTHYEITKYCFEQPQIAALEWLGDEAPHKRDWTSKAHERRLVQLFRRDARGLGGYAAYTYGRPVAKHALARVRR